MFYRLMDPDKNFYNEAKIAKITKTALIFFHQACQTVIDSRQKLLMF